MCVLMFDVRRLSCFVRPTHAYHTNGPTHYSPSLSSLMPKLLALLRSGVGLNTRCCAANVVVVLGTRFRPEVRYAFL